MLENIGLVLTRLPRFPELYPDNAEIKTRMVDIYDAVLEFCANAIHVFRVGKDKSRGTRKLANAVSFATALRVLWKPFSVDFDGIRDRIAKNVDSIKAEADMAEKRSPARNAGRTRLAGPQPREASSCWQTSWMIWASMNGSFRTTPSIATSGLCSSPLSSDSARSTPRASFCSSRLQESIPR